MVKWSPQSQRSILHQRELEKRLERCEGLIVYFGRDTQQFENIVKIQTENACSGTGMADHNLGLNVAALRDRRDQLKAYEDLAASLRKQIDALANPSDDEKRTRTANQGRLADLATSRVGIDREIEKSVTGLRALLERRAQSSAAIHDAARAVDLKVSQDGLDEERFERLLTALPASVVSGSESWLAWFLGSEKNKKKCVARVSVTFDETLAAAHVYAPGDSAEFTDEHSKRHARQLSVECVDRTEKALAS